MIGRVKRARGRGQALVEFALVLPLILLLIFGAVDFGRAIYAYNSMSEAARQANRTAIVNQDPTTIENVAIGASPASGLVAGNVCISIRQPDTLLLDCTSGNKNTDLCGSTNPATVQIGCLAFVTTKTTYYPITPVISNIVGILTLSSTSVGPIEAVCSSGCP
jgi:Flp pilus assembly protein TadG